MRPAAALAVLVLTACTGVGSPGATSTSPRSSPPAAAISVPPRDSELVDPGCGTTPIYRGGGLPDWATVNAPSLPYVVATPGIAIAYLFSYPLKAGLDSNKILWYVGMPRGGSSLEALGHPLGATTPTVTFSKAADSSPGEIYPTGPTVPRGGCWQFTLTWQDGAQHAEVDLSFEG